MFYLTGKVASSTFDLTGDLSASLRTTARGGGHKQIHAKLRRNFQPNFEMMAISHTLQFDGDNTAVLPSLRYAQTVDWRIILSALALTLLMASHGLAAVEIPDSATPVATPNTITPMTAPTTAMENHNVTTAIADEQQPVTAPRSQNATSAKPVAKFAQAEIIRFEEVISAATEKAENETDPQRVDRYAKQLKKLTHEMDMAKKAERQWRKEAKSKREPFAREHLKESIEALQDSGTRLLDEMIAADRQDGLLNGKTVSDRPASDQHLGQE